MEITFKGQVALVTGAASGLGLATAKAFAESGASVVLADVNEKEVQTAAKELADKGYKRRPWKPLVVWILRTTTPAFRTSLRKLPTRHSKTTTR